MVKNYMPDVAKLLGVELNEEFKLKKHAEIYKFTEEGLAYYSNGSREWRITPFTLNVLLRGEYEVEKLPWKPKDGDKYFYVCWHYFANGAIFTDSSVFKVMYETECLRVDIGNCFRTREEAEAAKYEVFKRLTGKDWAETYGKEGGNNATD